MKLIEQKANDIAKHLEAVERVAPQFFIDIAMIAALIDIVVNLIALSKECKHTPAQAIDKLQKPDSLTRLKIRQVIRQRLLKRGEWLHLRKHVEKGVIEVGKISTSQDMTTMFQEV
jgi:hypothetical protein